MSDHLYKPGETVMILAAFGTRSGPATIVRLMPANRDDHELQYRVKGVDGHERMILESGITLIEEQAVSPAGIGAGPAPREALRRP